MNINALNSSSFRLYLFGSFIALNGLWIQRIIIGWLAWEITHSPFYVGIAAFLSLAPTIFSGPVFGVLIDIGLTIENIAVVSGVYIFSSIILLYLVKNKLNPQYI